MPKSMLARSRSRISGASATRSSTAPNVKRKAPPVKAELPPRASFGAVSSMATLAPISRACSAALAAALPAPITSTSTRPRSAVVIPGSAPLLRHQSFRGGRQRSRRSGALQPAATGEKPRQITDVSQLVEPTDHLQGARRGGCIERASGAVEKLGFQPRLRQRLLRATPERAVDIGG